MQMAAEETVDAALVDGNLAGRRGYGREALPPGFEDAPIVEKPFTEEQVVATLERLLGGNVISLHGRREG